MLSTDHNMYRGMLFRKFNFIQVFMLGRTRHHTYVRIRKIAPENKNPIIFASSQLQQTICTRFFSHPLSLTTDSFFPLLLLLLKRKVTR